MQKATDAKTQTGVGQEKETIALAYNSALVKKVSNGDSSAVTSSELNEELDTSEANASGDTKITVNFIKSGNSYTIDSNGNVTPAKETPTVTTPPITAVAEKTKYKDTNNDIAIIPTGFRVSDSADEQTIDTGLVVIDSNNNEWVWVPVSNASEMYTKNDVGISLTGGEGKTYLSGVITKYYSNGDIISGITRGVPNSTDNTFREPELAVGEGAAYYDNSTSPENSAKKNYEIAGFSSLQNMAQSLVDDYEEMIKSVEKYGGFYIGRYELSGTIENPIEQGDKEPITNQCWYNLYKACKKFTINGVVESRMIWGCQWDETCKFISERGEKKQYLNGNYYYSTVLSSDGTTTIKARRTGKKINTGVTTYTMANKIYDLAGNCAEKTQEVVGNSNRMSRGGCFSGNTPSNYAGYRENEGTGNTDSTRPSLYIK